MKSIKSTERVSNTEGTTSVDNGVNEPLTSVNTQNRQILIKELNEMTVTSKKPSIKIQEDDILDDLMHTPSIIKSFQDIAPKPRSISTNCYQQIEILKKVPLEVNLRVQDQLRALQKKINLRKKKLLDKTMENEQLKKTFVSNIDQKEFLISFLKKVETAERSYETASNAQPSQSTTEISQLVSNYND